jgi:tRNA A37 threonylcarbamoyladenosine modification protein TsaB
MKDNLWYQITGQHITTPDELVAEISDKTIFCGEPAAAILEQLRDKLGQKAIISPPASRLRRAAFLAELGIKRLEAGDHDAPASLQPVYMRLPPITRPKRPLNIIKAK